MCTHLAACEGKDAIATLQRLQSSPAAMMSVASGCLHNTLRPMTSYAAGSHIQDAARSTELRGFELPPCAHPAEDVHRVLGILASAKLVSKLDVDWQAQLQVMRACMPDACTDFIWHMHDDSRLHDCNCRL